VESESTSGPGHWILGFGDIAMTGADGSTKTFYFRTSDVLSVSVAYANVSNVSVLTGPANIGGEAPLTDTTVTYYISDHLNSARMLLAASGWPTSSSTFYPFGQEQVATSTPNNYKFTGKERDT